MLDTCPHGVFPCLIMVGIEVFIDRGIWLFNLRMGGTAKVSVQVLGQVPPYGEIPSPQELFTESQWQL